MQVTSSDDVGFLPAAKPGRVQTRFFLIFPHDSALTENKGIYLIGDTHLLFLFSFYYAKPIINPSKILSNHFVRNLVFVAWRVARSDNNAHCIGLSLLDRIQASPRESQLPVVTSHSIAQFGLLSVTFQGSIQI